MALGSTRFQCYLDPIGGGVYSIPSPASGRAGDKLFLCPRGPVALAVTDGNATGHPQWISAGRGQAGAAGHLLAGAGFGIFEAQWVHNVIFASGCNWEAMRASGFEAIIPFWERFSTVAFHTAVTALAGYGLAKGWGWQFYLIASFLHAFFNYSTVFVQSGLLSVVGVEVFMAWVTALVTGVALWLRWRSSETLAEE